MKIRRLNGLLAWLATLAVAPAAPAMPAGQDQPGASTHAVSDAALEAQVTAYAAWLNRANAVHLGAQGRLMALGPAIQQINASGATAAEKTRQLRALLQEILAALDAAGAEFESLDTPDFAALDLADLQPAALKRQMLQLNRDYRGLIADLLRAADIGPGNPEALNAALQRLSASIASIYESQILLARAAVAASLPDSSEHAINSMEVINLRAMYRLFRGYSPSRPAVDQALPADLTAFADELERHIGNGETRLEAELSDLERERAGEGGASASLLRRSIAAISLSREYFPIARRLLAHLRALSRSTRGQVLTRPVIAEAVIPFRQFRMAIDEVAMRQNQVLANAP